MAGQFVRPEKGRPLAIQRGWWFSRAIQRLDLVSLAEVADWYARSPGSLDRDEARRAQAHVELEYGIAHGEFGPAVKPLVAYLPRPVPLDRRGRFPLRLTKEQIAYMRQVGLPVIADLFAPRPLAVRWCVSREIPIPPWLDVAHAFVGVPQIIEGESAKPAVRPSAPSAPAKRTPGPKPVEREKVVRAMVRDVRSGKKSEDDLFSNKGIKLVALAAEYGVRSNSTVTKALAKAAAELGVVPNRVK